MAPQVSDEMCARMVVWHEERHFSPKEIADLAGCSVRTVYYILSYNREFNTLRDPFTRGAHHGRPRTLDTGDMNYIAALVEAQPKIYIDEVQEQLLRARDVLVSIPTLSHALRHMALTNKQVANAALERNELLRATWQAAYANIPAEYCVWLDEASVDDLTNQRTTGWAAMGRACVCRAAFIRGQQYSILPALTCDGIIALDIFEGSVNKERFIQFLNEQLVSVPFGNMKTRIDSFVGTEIKPVSWSKQRGHLG